MTRALTLTGRRWASGNGMRIRLRQLPRGPAEEEEVTRAAAVGPRVPLAAERYGRLDVKLDAPLDDAGAADYLRRVFLLPPRPHDGAGAASKDRSFRGEHNALRSSQWNRHWEALRCGGHTLGPKSYEVGFIFFARQRMLRPQLALLRAAGEAGVALTPSAWSRVFFLLAYQGKLDFFRRTVHYFRAAERRHAPSALLQRDVVAARVFAYEAMMQLAAATGTERDAFDVAAAFDAWTAGVQARAPDATPPTPTATYFSYWLRATDDDASARRVFREMALRHIIPTRYHYENCVAACVRHGDAARAARVMTAAACNNIPPTLEMLRHLIRIEGALMCRKAGRPSLELGSAFPAAPNEGLLTTSHPPAEPEGPGADTFLKRCRSIFEQFDARGVFPDHRVQALVLRHVCNLCTRADAAVAEELFATVTRGNAPDIHTLSPMLGMWLRLGDSANIDRYVAAARDSGTLIHTRVWEELCQYQTSRGARPYRLRGRV